VIIVVVSDVTDTRGQETMRGIQAMGGEGKHPRGLFLEDLTWLEAEQILTPQTVVVIPLGAAAKEHGPHLRLKNDWVLADYLKRCICEAAEVVIAPTLTYSFYPAFLAYPGSISLRLETARDLVIDLCRSLSSHGPRRFYVLNTGISTLRALQPAAEILATGGILLRYTNLSVLLESVTAHLAQQEGGSHADEIETSMMLAIAPELVNMNLAVKDYHPGTGGLTRNPDGSGVYSPSGIYGDPTLATKEKGEQVLQALVAGILQDLALLSVTPA
jgi:creatinine amidohydrolase